MIQEESTRQRVLVVVKRHEALIEADILHDHYRQFNFSTAGCLFYETLGDLEIVEPKDVLHHFAKTAYRPFHGEVFASPAIHVLPCSKVSAI